MTKQANVFILKERVLNDDTLYIAPEGMVFKGNYKAIIKQYRFQTTNSDSLKVLRFRTLENMQKYVNKHYPEFDEILVY